MKTTTIYGLILVITVIWLSSCSALLTYQGNQPLELRQDDSILLIGCVIVVPDSFRYLSKDPLDLTFVHYSDVTPQDKPKLFIVKTDSNGYFAVPNLPKGKYSICQIRSGVTLVHQEGEFGESEYGFDNTAGDGMFSSCPSWASFKYSVEPSHSIVDMSYTVICYNFNYKADDVSWLQTYHRYELDGESFQTERLEGHHNEPIVSYWRFNRPPIVEYFLEKFPESEWADNLRQLLRKQMIENTVVK